MTQPTERPGAILTRLLLGNRVQQAVHVAAKYGLADLLADGPRTAADLAAAANLHAGALGRLLRVLASFGVFAERDDGRYELTPVAELLRTGTRESRHAFAMWSGHPSYGLFGALDYSVRTGKPAFNKVYGCSFYEYLDQHPDVSAVFDQFMARQTAPMGPVLAARDWPDAGTVVDVGGGRGELLTAVLAAHPGLRGVLVDQPHALDGSTETLTRAGVADRCTVSPGDYIESVPRGDVYVLKNIVHGFDDATAARILANCHRSMAPGGHILIVEFLIPPGNAPFPGKLMDLLMLVGSEGGRERTEPEFRSLCAEAELELTDIQATKYAYSVLRAQ